MKKILIVERLVKTFIANTHIFKPNDVVSAVNNISFDMEKQEVLGIVGESGCGKSTLAKLLVQSIKPDSGAVYFHGENIYNKIIGKKQRREKRKKIQMVYQNPYSSLNPKMTILENITFGPISNGIKKVEAEKKAREYLKAVGLQEIYANMYPRNLSGGQRQRVAIARALAMEPEIILADEPVSALDKSVQAQVLNLFQDLKGKFGISIIFISHDLSVVEYMSDNIIVMYLGEIVEKGPAREIYEHPCHPYTKELLSSIPEMNSKDIDEAKGIIELPSPINPPSGCRYHPRCPYCTDKCKVEHPELKQFPNGHSFYCNRSIDKDEL